MNRLSLLLAATLTLGFGIVGTQTKAQSAEERKAVTESANLEGLRRLATEFQANFERQEAMVLVYLKKHPDKPRTFEKAGSTYYLKRIDEDGNPVYINTKISDGSKDFALSRPANVDHEHGGGAR